MYENNDNNDIKLINNLTILRGLLNTVVVG